MGDLSHLGLGQDGAGVLHAQDPPHQGGGDELGADGGAGVGQDHHSHAVVGGHQQGGGEPRHVAVVADDAVFPEPVEEEGQAQALDPRVGAELGRHHFGQRLGPKDPGPVARFRVYKPVRVAGHVAQ